MTLLFIVLISLFIDAIGFAIISLGKFLPYSSTLEKIGYSWGLGVGMIGIELFIFSYVGIRWNIFYILFPWICVFFVYIVKRPKFHKISLSWNLSKIEKILIILLICLNIFVAFESVLRPVQAWDGWDNWLFRPKIYFMHNNLDLNYVRYTNDEYPLIMPLMNTFGYIIIGHIDDKNILFFYYMFYLSLGLVFFSRYKKMFTTKSALLITFLLLSTQNIIRHGGRFEAGQSDLALGYFILLVSILFMDFVKNKNTKTLFLLSIITGITGQIKNDGMAIVLIISFLIIALSIYYKKYSYLLYLIPTYVITAIWTSYKMINHYPTNFLFRSHVTIHGDKIFNIILVMVKELINIQNWNLLWVVFLFAILVNFKKLNAIKYLLIIFILQLSSYFVIFMISPLEPVTLVKGIIDKLYLHLAPLALFITGILSYNQLKKYNKGKLWNKFLK